MESSIYIPKWLIVAFLAAVGCAAAWMFGGADLVMASIGSLPGPADSSAPVVQGAAAPAAAGSTAVADPAAPAVASAEEPSPELALQGVASTTNSTVRITSTPDDQRGEAMTPNSTVRIVSTPDGHAGEAITPSSNVRINAMVIDPNGAAVPATAAAGPAPTGPAAAPAGSVATTAAAPTAAAPVTVMVQPQMTPPQMAQPLSAPDPGLGSWGPQGPLPPLVPPPFFGENIWNPLPGATSRGIAFSEWESYRTDVAGRNILVTTDDSNFFRDRDGKLNANTGDTDASGLNVIGAVDSVIRGSESADEAPWQTMAAALVDLAGEDGTTPPPDDDDDDDGDDDEDSDEFQEPNGDSPAGTPAPIGSQPSQGSSPTSPAPSSGDEGGVEGFDFPYKSWVEHANASVATAVHTDEGTTLASGSDAIVIGADGYDDDDNRAVGENITITRDDGNVVIGGTGDVNAQIGDSEQGAVIMDVTRTFIQGGGAY